jgi:hypothetical protein
LEANLPKILVLINLNHCFKVVEIQRDLLFLFLTTLWLAVAHPRTAKMIELR